MYAAPEVIAKYINGGTRRYGRASNVYGIGCVFCEMLNVWLGHSISEFHSYLSKADGTAYGPHRYSDRIPHMEKRFKSSVVFLRCIRPMLSLETSARPTAAMTLDIILDLYPWCSLKCECIDSVPERRSVTVI
jgi:serine/threonine protein kinase